MLPWKGRRFCTFDALRGWVAGIITYVVWLHPHSGKWSNVLAVYLSVHLPQQAPDEAGPWSKTEDDPVKKRGKSQEDACILSEREDKQKSTEKSRDVSGHFRSSF